MHHICLVSQQPMPNFLPILQDELKPSKVTLVVSEKMRDRADYLRKALEEIQIEVTDDISIGSNEADISTIEDILIEWIGKNEQDDLYLNVTGGNKPMAIAAQEVFRLANKPIFYVDIGSDQVIWVNPREHAQLHLVNQPTLKQFFKLNGYEFLSGADHSSIQNEKWRALGDTLAADMGKWGGALGLLNAKASSSRERNSLTCPLSDEEKDVMKDLLVVLHQNELIVNESDLHFCSQEALKFCNGEWLEHATFLALKKLQLDKKRAMMNVQVRKFRNQDDTSKGIANEFDSVVFHRNTLYIIECKTKNMKREGVADDAIYKLAEEVRETGLRATGILISCRPIRKADRDRAGLLGVKVIDCLTNLDIQLRTMLRIEA